MAYCEGLPYEPDPTCAAFLLLAARYFVDRGIGQRCIKPHCSWQDRKVERLHRVLATDCAYRHPFTSPSTFADTTSVSDGDDLPFPVEGCTTVVGLRRDLSLWSR